MLDFLGNPAAVSLILMFIWVPFAAGAYLMDVWKPERARRSPKLGRPIRHMRPERQVPTPASRLSHAGG